MRRRLAATLVAALALCTAGTAARADEAELDPRAAFWREPSHAHLSAYGEHLEEALLTPAQRADRSHLRPRHAEFERMKAHLARGVAGPAPAPYPRWDELKRDASTEQRWAFAPDRSQRDGGPVDGRASIEAIELPAVAPSLFGSERELAAPAEHAAEVAGRFGLRQRIATAGRAQLPAAELERTAGAWDVFVVTESLDRPVTRLRLQRDGRLDGAPTALRRTLIERSDAEYVGCDNYADGFAFGDAAPPLWAHFGTAQTAAHEASLRRRPAGSLLFVHLPAPWTGPARATVTRQRQDLDRAATGFASAESLYFDLDGDGRFDIAVWEATGRATGHLEPGPAYDVAHHRVFFANIGGHWHLLGHDRFSFGCGC